VDVCGTSSKPYFVGVTAVTKMSVTAVTRRCEPEHGRGRQGQLPAAAGLTTVGRTVPSVRAMILLQGLQEAAHRGYCEQAIQEVNKQSKKLGDDLDMAATVKAR
jgi:hypothetical protein